MDQSQQQKDKFQEMVKQASPNSHLLADCIKAFVVGGIICSIGQFILNYFVSMGQTKDQAGLVTSIILVFTAILMTGLGWYSKLGKFAGAGSIVPITGFANSIASPAIEFKKEGYVMGVGAKMFIVAGPVIVYGTVTSIIVGFIYYILK